MDQRGFIYSSSNQYLVVMMNLLVRITTLLLMISILFSMGEQAMAQFDCNWSYRSEVVITENSGSTLSDYQMVLNLDSNDFHANYNWSTAGQDLRVLDTNDSSELSFYIGDWNAAAKTAEVWIRIPSLAANSSKTFYLYYDNTSASSASDATAALTETGIRFYTRFSTANPNNKAAAFNFFNSAADGVAGYGCTLITNFTGVNNRTQFSPPSITDNFGAYSETFFEVKASEVGSWSIRYGADFGRGGGLYVDDVTLEEDWNNDLWWLLDWAHADVLQGSINLSAGYHRLEVIGFEECCDGGITVEYRKPGGSYQTYNTSNINIVSRRCPITEPMSSIPAKTHFPPSLNISKTSNVVSDPVNNTTFPKRIAGARVRYTITVSNTGSPVDVDSINIKDPVPGSTNLLLANNDFTFQDGTPSSGLSFVYSGAANSIDNVAFSNTGGDPFTYIPSPVNNTDTNITNLQLSPSGQFGCSNTAQPTSFSLTYDVIIN